MRNFVDSPRFQKYVHTIGKEMGDPSDTRVEQQRIFDRCCTLSSFSERTLVSKLGRWFSWNDTCHKALPEFTAGKMVLEDYLEGIGVKDPDESAIAFDDLKKNARARTPQAELTELMSSGGGLVHCYRLHYNKLYSLCQVFEVATKCWWDY